MNWQDKGIVLSAKPWAEKHLLVTVLTQNNGVSKGLVRVTKTLSQIQPGTFVAASWKARLSEHLGTFTLDTEDVPFVRLMHLPKHLLLLKTITAILEYTLVERHQYPELFAETHRIFNTLHQPSFPLYYEYAHFEFLLIKELGFGMDLSCCALCQQEKPIYYVSPKTGKGACLDCGQIHAARVFAFNAPLFDAMDLAQLTQMHYREAFLITTHFLSNHICAHKKSDLPIARLQFLDFMLQKAA
ncbi:MAG: DNA repair protein RecO [Holosporales bacterium]